MTIPQQDIADLAEGVSAVVVLVPLGERTELWIVSTDGGATRVGDAYTLREAESVARRHLGAGIELCYVPTRSEAS